MKLVSLEIAMSLVNRSERTLWRMVSSGLVLKEIQNGAAMLQLDSLKPHFCIPFEDEDYALLAAAIAGDAASQTDVALAFLSQNKPHQAIYWLNLAVAQDFPDAMNFLGRCHIEGNGVGKAEHTGIVWITKAAALGHVISQDQVKGLSNFL